MQFWELPGLTGDSLRVALGSRLNCLKPLIACKSVGSRWAYNLKVESSNPSPATNPFNNLRQIAPSRAAVRAAVCAAKQGQSGFHGRCSAPKEYLQEAQARGASSGRLDSPERPEKMLLTSDGIFSTP